MLFVGTVNQLGQLLWGKRRYVCCWLNKYFPFRVTQLFSLCSGRWSCRVNTPSDISLHVKLRRAMQLYPSYTFAVRATIQRNRKVDIYIFFVFEPLSLVEEIESWLYAHGCLLGYCAVQSGRSLLTFRRCLLPPSSGRWSLHRFHRLKLGTLRSW
jgi:hypothetical protein